MTSVKYKADISEAGGVVGFAPDSQLVNKHRKLKACS
jgi:hypothetical protein